MLITLLPFFLPNARYNRPAPITTEIIDTEPINGRLMLEDCNELIMPVAVPVPPCACVLGVVELISV